MSMTNFAALTSQQKLVWSRDVWQAARDQMFINKFIGESDGSLIQRITELTKSEKGERPSSTWSLTWSKTASSATTSAKATKRRCSRTTRSSTLT
jgi:hypothetical protein